MRGVGDNLGLCGKRDFDFCSVEMGTHVER